VSDKIKVATKGNKKKKVNLLFASDICVEGVNDDSGLN